MVDKSLLLVLARQEMSKSSATAPAELSRQSVSAKYTHIQNRHAHKHIVCRTGIVLNTKTEPHSNEGGGGQSEGSLLSRRKRDGDIGEIMGTRFRRSRDRGTEQPGDHGDDSGDGDHFSDFLSERGWMGVQKRRKDINGMFAGLGIEPKRR